jgi:hypothetical protein
MGTGTTTSINIGKQNVSVNTSILNASTINTSTIDSLGSILRMGTGTTTSINIGKQNVSVNMSILNVSTINTTTIDTNANGTISIGSTNTSNIYIGESLTNGILNLGQNISGGFINIGANGVTGNATIIIGNQGNVTSTNPLTLRTLGTLNLANSASTINMGFGALSGSNTINIGSSAITTANIYGTATNFLATANNFTNAITAGAVDCLTAGGNLLVGATNAILTLGNTARATTLRGSSLAINLAGSLGSSGQVLTSNGTNATWQTPAGGGGGGWTGTATTDLNMASNSITNVSSIYVNSNVIYGGTYVYGKLSQIINTSLTADVTINGTTINMQFVYWIKTQTAVSRNIFLPTTTYVGQIIIIKNDSTSGQNAHATAPNTINANIASSTTSTTIQSYTSRMFYCANAVPGSINWIVLSFS